MRLIAGKPAVYSDRSHAQGCLTGLRVTENAELTYIWIAVRL